MSFQKILWTIFAFIGLMIFIRFAYTGRYAFIFLVWNLFLAWIPFTISSLFTDMKSSKKWKQLLSFSAWLIFFPNALYIVTDLIHLQMVTSVPKWYDAVLLFASSVTGLMMAFISLLRVESLLRHKFSDRIVHASIIAILFLGSFGVYLGRFLRWNSWDIISNPFGLIVSISQRFISPFHHLQTWGITFLLTTLFYLLYQAIKNCPVI